MRAWIDSLKSTDLALCTKTIAEIERGLAPLPRGKRRKRLEASFSIFVKEAFAGRIFPFDEAAAHIYGQIAAIAKMQNAAIATRNVNDFEGCGIDLINPWDAQET